MPKAQALMRKAAFDPPTVKLLGQAFDEAWAASRAIMEARSPSKLARLKLANIVLNLAAEGERDLERLKDRAVRSLTVDDP